MILEMTEQMDFERDVKFCVALLPFLRVSYDRYNTWGLKFSITFSKYLNIRHGYAWDFTSVFSFFNTEQIPTKPARIRLGFK
jgi:hypothetical protein